jgi:hypothetical protein
MLPPIPTLSHGKKVNKKVMAMYDRAEVEYKALVARRDQVRLQR